MRFAEGGSSLQVFPDISGLGSISTAIHSASHMGRGKRYLGPTKENGDKRRTPSMPRNT